MTYRVNLSGRAEAGLAQVVGWLANRSPGAARRLADRFEDALARLETNPYSCGLAYENNSFPEETSTPAIRAREGAEISGTLRGPRR